jgi:signal transduction histidine kinase
VAIAVSDGAGKAYAAHVHEVRDSLAALRLIVEGLREGVIDPAPESGILDQMMLHVRHLSEQLDDELRARETRCGAVIARPVRIGAFLSQWSDAMRPKAERHGIDLSVELAPSLPDVECRVAQVARVLLNLLDNAIAHTPAGGSVIVRAVVHPGGVQIQVNDTGPGLPAATRVDPPQARGRGIAPARPGRRGLVIARTIVEAHGGMLWAEPGARGASVRFYLPATARTGA